MRPVRLRRGLQKYRNIPIVVDGVRFDSQAEAARWGELLALARHGHIWDLRRQVRFDLAAGEQRVGVYVADFSYNLTPETRAWPQVVEDVKGMMTPLAKWKLRHFRAQYGFAVTVIHARDIRR
jgi:hypothetical protein